MKAIKAISGVLAALALLFPLLGKGGEEESVPDCLRLHIVANSDSEEDQRIKLEVRDALLARMRMEDVSTKREAEERLLSLGAEFQSIAERVLEEQGADYGAELISGEFDFPERDYAGEVYPAGRYSALRVILGEGEGHNWWCVMFPPLCVIDDGSGVARNADGTLEFRSILAEIWRSIFG